MSVPFSPSKKWKSSAESVTFRCCPASMMYWPDPAGGKQGLAHVEEHLCLVAHHFGALCIDQAGALFPGRGWLNLLGPYANLPLAALGKVGAFLLGQGHHQVVVQYQALLRQLGLGKVHLGRTDKPSHKGVGRLVVQLQGGAHLLDFAPMEHQDVGRPWSWPPPGRG